MAKPKCRSRSPASASIRRSGSTFITKTRTKTKENRGRLGYFFFRARFLARLFRVLRVSAGLGKIAVRGFQQRILITMSQLALHRGISGWFFRPVLLDGALASVLVVGKRRIQIVPWVSHTV